VTDRQHWREYLGAARRKIAIAEYHLGALEHHLKLLSPPYGSVPIAVQAHFEGILYAFVAAADQMAEVTSRPADPGVRNHMDQWRNSSIYVDVRDIRVRATHHHYAKVLGGLRLEVQPPLKHPPYEGSRVLVKYASAAVAHLRKLGPVIDIVEDSLAERGSL
jgi:hypothetical protein